ncbi:MAG: hypothetical protein EXR71_08535 [Myxococcales bacterium]|nr:hypothetical protein [Myxococcales bacterium]
MILFVAAALAASATPAPWGVREIAVGVAGSGESVFQGGLVDAYPKLGGSLSLEGTVSSHVSGPLELGLELGYRRLTGQRQDGSSSWIWYAPVSLLASGRLDVGAVSVLGGLGPSMVVWQEQGSPEAMTGRQDWGVRFGVLVETSARWHTPFLRQPMYLEGTSAARLDIFASFGARFSDVADSAAASGCREEPCGFDWSAFRVGAGVLVRF